MDDPSPITRASGGAHSYLGWSSAQGAFAGTRVVTDQEHFPRVCAWLDRIRSLPFARRNPDVVRRGVTEKFSTRAGSPYEGARIIWRGDRLEWLFANGFHGWWATELTAGRAVVPLSL